MINVKSFFIVICLSVLITDANASVTTGYNRADLFNQIKRAIKSPKIPGSPNIPSTLIGLGVTGLIDGITKIQKDMENPNFIEDKAKEHMSHTDTQTTHGGAGGVIGYDYIYRGTAYSSPEEVKAQMIREIEENGWKFSRQNDGYYYQHWYVNMQTKTMTLYAQVAKKNDPVCARMNDRCGWSTSFSGEIVPIGKTNKRTIVNTKEQARDIALDKVINDLIDKHEQELKSATPQELPQDKDKPKPVPVPVPNEATDEATQPHTPTAPKDTPEPFEASKFCTWATPVCNFMDWVKQEPPEPNPPEQVPKASLSDLGLDENELFKQRVKFDGQCPKHELKFSINGKQIIEPIPTHHFCNLLEQIAPWLLAFSYLSAGFFVIRNL